MLYGMPDCNQPNEQNTVPEKRIEGFIVVRDGGAAANTLYGVTGQHFASIVGSVSYTS